MADEPIDAGAPPATEPSDSTPQTSPETPKTEPSFGDNLRAELAPEPAPAVDFDTRLATEREAWQKEQDAKYGWAKDYQPEVIQSWRQSIEEAQQAPVAVATRLLAAAIASGNPQHRQEALSFAGRLLGGQQGQQATQPAAPQPVDLKPIPAQDGSGNTVNLYSVEQVHALIDKVKTELRGELTPIQDAYKTQAERQAAYERQQQDEAAAHAIFDRMSKRPGFKDNQPEIYKAWSAMAGNDNAQQARENLDDAYVSVVFGKLQAQSTSVASADHARRAAASTGRVVTSQPTQASPSAPVSFAEKIAQEMQRRRGA